MDKKYIKYSTEDFAQDINFIRWVKENKNHDEWENFVLENPSMAKDIDDAKKIVSTFRFSLKEDIPESELKAVYKNIEKFYTQHHKPSGNIRLMKLLRYAAIVILILSIGGAIPYIYFSKQKDLFSELPTHPSNGNDAKLVLSGGEEIFLKEKESDLQFDASGNQVKIDQDSIVRYNQNVDKSAKAQIIIPYGRRSNLLLSDGTKVWLNAGSRLIFPQKFTGDKRQVHLKGEAYFHVSKNKDVPFIVTTDKMNVIVHGTQFNVRDIESDNEVEVVLVEGAVGLKKNSVMNFLDKEVKLVPNQKAVFTKTDNKISVESNVDVSYYVSWKVGLLEFDKESITNVFKKLSQYYNVRFETEDGVELSKRISGKLDLKGSLKDVLKVVSDAAPVSFRINDDKVFVTSKMKALPMK